MGLMGFPRLLNERKQSILVPKKPEPGWEAQMLETGEQGSRLLWGPGVQTRQHGPQNGCLGNLVFDLNPQKAASEAGACNPAGKALEITPLCAEEEENIASEPIRSWAQLEGPLDVDVVFGGRSPQQSTGWRQNLTPYFADATSRHLGGIWEPLVLRNLCSNPLLRTKSG